MPRLNINIDRLTEQGGSTTENLAGDSPLPPQELREVEPSSTSGGQKSFKERLLSAGFQRGREGDPFLFKVKGDTVRTFDTRSGDFAEMKLSTLAERDPDFVKNVLGVDVAPTRPTPDPTTPVDELIRAPDVDTSQPLNTSRQGSLENSVFAEKEEGRSLRQFRDVQEAAERVLNRRDEQRSGDVSRSVFDNVQQNENSIEDVRQNMSLTESLSGSRTGRINPRSRQEEILRRLPGISSILDQFSIDTGTTGPNP